MPVGLLPNTLITQVAIVTDDIETAAARWAELLGVPAPTPAWTDTRELAHTTYRGAPTEGRCLLAFFDLGPQVKLELIQPDHEPSTWREFLDANGPGLHHIAFNLKGMDQALAVLDAHQMPTVQRGDYTGGRYSYVASDRWLGCILELLEDY
jgi:methylmalonyl-CoA/ethylmalonyl-CoA epimerase